MIMKSLKTVLLTLLLLAVYLLHQDFWNWKKAAPLILGFLPVGLAYHAAYSVLAAVTMAVLVKFAWPKHLEGASNE
jgi:chromate transport protein ChrA